MSFTRKETLRTITAGDGDRGADASITISTGGLDRDRDRILPSAWMLDNYRKNPVVLFQHGRGPEGSFPIGTTTEIDITDTGLRAAFRWLRDDPLADRVKNAWSQGVLRTASVGFLPVARDHNAEGGYDYTKAELLEWSLVVVPSNPQATRVLRGLGLLPADDPGTDWFPSLRERAATEDITRTVKRMLGHPVDLTPAMAALVDAVRQAVSRARHEAASAHAPAPVVLPKWTCFFDPPVRVPQPTEEPRTNFWPWPEK